MDNLIIPPQDPVPSPSKSKLPVILLVIILLFLFGFDGILLGKYLNISQNISSIPTLAPKPTVIPTITFVEFDLQKKTELNIIRPGLEMFRAEQGKYPNALKELVPKYMVAMPKDPQTNSEYFYQVSQTGLDYSLSAKLNDGTTYTVNAPK